MSSYSAATDNVLHPLIYRLYILYRDHIPTHEKERFLAILHSCPGVPSAQWTMDALDDLDDLLDPLRTLPKEVRRGRGAIRLACLRILSRQIQSKKLRQVDSESNQ